MLSMRLGGDSEAMSVMDDGAHIRTQSFLPPPLHTHRPQPQVHFHLSP